MESGDRSLPVTPGQLDIWLAQETGQSGTEWQLGLFVKIEGAVDRDALEWATRRVVAEAEPVRAALPASMPGMAFIVLVAVGADYNMLLISRIRDESPYGIRSGVIRTVRTTGGVITSAGIIFAAPMFAMLFSSINSIVQAGFVIGVGLLLDTFVVRTITVPALAVLIGKANWWPSGWRQKSRPSSKGPSMRRTPALAAAGGGVPKAAPGSPQTAWLWAAPFRNKWLRQP